MIAGSDRPGHTTQHAQLLSKKISRTSFDADREYDVLTFTVAHVPEYSATSIRQSDFGIKQEVPVGSLHSLPCHIYSILPIRVLPIVSFQLASYYRSL